MFMTRWPCPRAEPFAFIAAIYLIGQAFAFRGAETAMAEPAGGAPCRPVRGPVRQRRVQYCSAATTTSLCANRRNHLVRDFCRKPTEQAVGSKVPSQASGFFIRDGSLRSAFAPIRSYRCLPQTASDRPIIESWRPALRWSCSTGSIRFPTT